MQTAPPVAMTELRAQAIAPRTADFPVAMGFGNNQSFELMQRAAKLLANSTLVPASYRVVNEDRRGNVTENPAGLPNCVVALNMAQRMGADPLMVMQNLYIVEGRPAWSSQFIIAAINNCGRYSPLRFEMSELEPEREIEYTEYEWQDQPNGRAKKVAVTRKIKIRNRTCTAWAVERETGQRLESPVISIEMAVREGWYGKNGSKWQTMPDVMLRYRAASFFGKLYAPELLMGLQTAEEVGDIIDVTPEPIVRQPVDVGTLRANQNAQEAVVAHSQYEGMAAGSPGGAEQPEDAGTGQGGSEATGAEGTASSDPTAQSSSGNWQPTPEEKAEIAARERAEAGADAQPQQATSSRRGRGNLDIG